MNTVIREYQHEDLASVRQLLHELGYPLERETLLENIGLIRQRGGVIFVAESEGTVAGCLCAGINAAMAEGMYGEILSLIVLPEYRGLGLGKRLTQQAEEWFRPQVSKIRVRANSLRAEARRFYASMGFQEIKTQVSFMKTIGSE